MKKLVLLFTAMILGTTSVFATGIKEDKVATSNAYGYDNSFIFVENGITFAVYPDGEFDFYIDNQVSGTRNGVTFNSGYDYSPYAQYDDYGAVIQVENVPIYYDYYGRVSQIGEVDINYLNRRVNRIGGMYVYYNNRGFYDYHTGYINIYNRHYVYQPFHRWFARPAINLCLVYNRPYRRYYTPVRYTYYNPYRNNYRKAYVNIGRTYRYNKVRPERATIYRNDKRVAVRDNSYRANKSIAQRDNGLRTNRSIASNNTARYNRGTEVNQSSTVRRSSDFAGRNNQDHRVTKREVTRSTPPNRTVKRGNDVGSRNGHISTVTKREVTRTPSSTTVKRSSTTYKKPEVRSTTSRSSQNSSVRSSGTRSVTKVPNRSSTSASSRSATTRSNRRN
ncbi:hypothetical protein ACNR9Q_10585 [Maribacter sp. X9]|uniref:hypothetical protein n=1 Tax=Maribacter sp. X9 TaxID=3402159 RepID=UPI003AF38018